MLIILCSSIFPRSVCTLFNSDRTSSAGAHIVSFVFHMLFYRTHCLTFFAPPLCFRFLFRNAQLYMQLVSSMYLYIAIKFIIVCMIPHNTFGILYLTEKYMASSSANIHHRLEKLYKNQGPTQLLSYE